MRDLRTLPLRELELLAHSLRTWVDLERTAGNAIAASLVDEYCREVERCLPRVDRTVSAPPPPRPPRFVDEDGTVRVRREAA